MDIGAAIIEVGSASRKAMRIIATSRREVVSALLTLPELNGDKQQAMKIAQVVWDMQGKVDTRRPSVRAQFVEEMPQTRRPEQPEKVAPPAAETHTKATPTSVAETPERPGPTPLLQVT